MTSRIYNNKPPFATADELVTSQWHGGVRRAGDGVVEMIGHPGRRKLISMLGASGLAVFFVWSLFDGGEGWGRILYDFGYGTAWGGTDAWDRGYAQCLEGRFYDACYPGITPWEYVWAVPLDNGSTFWGYVVVLAMALFLPVLFLTRRPPTPPVRFDLVRRIAYGWAPPRLFGLLGRGGLHIARFEDVEMRDYGHRDSFTYNSFINPIVLTLPSAEDPRRTRRFPLGAMDRGAVVTGWKRIVQRMPDADRARAWAATAPEAFDTALYARFSLLPPRRLPDDIDARARAWLAAQAG